MSPLKRSQGPPGGGTEPGGAQGTRVRLSSLDPRSLTRVVRATITQAAQDRISLSAAGLAFHWFLAIFPTTIAVLGVIHIVGLSPGDLRAIVHALGVLLPRQVSNLLTQALRSPQKASTGVLELAVGLLVALWSAAGAMSALQIGLDVAYEVEGDRGFVGRRLMALPLLGATVVFGVGASVLLVLGDPLRSLLPHSLPLAQPAFDAAWTALRWAAAIVLVLLLFSTFYVLGPNHARRTWEWVSPGSCLATAVWLAASAGFSYYLDAFGRESRTYGGFAGVAVMLLWLYLTGVAILLGAELNCELARPAPPPGGSRAPRAAARRAGGAPRS